MITVVAIAGLVYFGLCGYLFVSQRSLIYFPQPQAVNDNYNRLLLTVGKASVQVTVHEPANIHAVMYFGGNAENVAYSLPDIAAAFPDHALYLMHYRGYGGSDGEPTQAALFADALALHKEVQARHDNIVVIGRSLGSGVATYLASQRDIQRLVLVTPFDSLLELAARQFPYLPVHWLLLDKYESWRYAEQVTEPTLIITAEHDEIVPRESSDSLYQRFRSGVASIRMIRGVGHNSISNSTEYLPLLGQGWNR